MNLSRGPEWLGQLLELLRASAHPVGRIVYWLRFLADSLERNPELLALPPDLEAQE